MIGRYEAHLTLKLWDNLPLPSLGGSVQDHCELRWGYTIIKLYDVTNVCTRSIENYARLFYKENCYRRTSLK